VAWVADTVVSHLSQQSNHKTHRLSQSTHKIHRNASTKRHVKLHIFQFCEKFHGVFYVSSSQTLVRSSAAALQSATSQIG